MIMIVKTPGSQMAPSSSRERRRGDGRGEGGEWRCPDTTAAFAKTLASSLTPSKPEEGR